MGRKMIARGWLTATGAAQYLGVAPELVYRAVSSGELPAYEKPATRTKGRSGISLISVEDIDEWVRSWPRAGRSQMEVVA